MIRTLWFIIKLGILVALAVWIADQPGQVNIKWEDYTIQVYLGLFLAGLFGILILSLLLFKIIRAVTDIPKNFKQKQALNNKDKGYRALTVGLSAVAAGDTKEAAHQAKKARKLLKDEEGLPRLLEAQAARLEGREDDARAHFTKLLDHKDAAFLGVRGLLHNALEKNNTAEALLLTRQALQRHPKQGWILKLAYELELKNRDIESARKILKRAERAGAILSEKAKSDRVAMSLHEAEELRKTGYIPQAEKKYKEAYALDKLHIPTVERMASFYLNNEKRKDALHALEKIWKYNPHPDLLPLWEQAAPGSHKNSPIKMLDWYKRLIKINADSAASHQAYAAIAMQQSLWGEARDHLLTAARLNPIAKTYKMLAALEKAAGSDHDIIENYLDKAAEAPTGKVWICTETGMVYDHWQPYAPPHNSFNTIVWDEPALQSTKHPDLMALDTPYGILEAVS